MSRQDENIREGRDVKYPKEPIPDYVLEGLLAKYNTPGNTTADRSFTDMWGLVEQLKAWLVKPVEKGKFDYSQIAWAQIKEALEEAVVERDLKPIDDFTKAWREVEAVYTEPKRSGGEEIDPWKRKDAENEKLMAERIRELIGGSVSNKPNSPSKVRFLECIDDLQRKLKRAPSQREIENKSELKKNMVSSFANEMGLDGLLSLNRKAK